MSKDFQDLKAWVHWKEKEKDLSEDDVLLVKDIKDLLSKVGTYKARMDEAVLEKIETKYNSLALVEALEKIADPRKRDHKEPDSYTELGCVMNIANEALKVWKENNES